MTNREAALILEGEAEFLYAEDMPYARQAFNMAIDALQERSSAKWVKSDSDKDFLTCSHCKQFPLRFRMAYKKEVTKLFHYCPNCGAKMKEART